MRIFGNAATGTKPNFWLFCENRHLTLPFSQAKSVQVIYFKIWECVKHGSGLIIINFVSNRRKLQSVTKKVGSTFCVTLYLHKCYRKAVIYSYIETNNRKICSIPFSEYPSQYILTFGLMKSDTFLNNGNPFLFNVRYVISVGSLQRLLQYW